MKILSHIMIATLLVLLTGCRSASPSEKLLGKWQEEDGGDTTEFFEDGTFRTKAAPGSRKVSEIAGDWTMLEDGRLKLDITFMGQRIVSMATLSFEGEKMVFTSEDGTRSVSVRIE